MNIFYCVDGQKIVMHAKSRIKKTGFDFMFKISIYVFQELWKTYSPEIKQQCLLVVVAFSFNSTFVYFCI